MPLAGCIATLRGLLNSTERGVIPAGIAFHGKPTVRRIREAVAIDVLQQAANLLAGALREDTARITEAAHLGHHLIVLGKSKGLLRAFRPDVERGADLKNLWGSLAEDSDIRAGAIRLESLVGPNDVLLVLDRAIRAITSANADS
jgi:hypothetical protein